MYLYRNELMTSTWLQNPDKRPTFAVIVQKISNFCNNCDPNSDEDSSIHEEDTAESNGYISVLPE